MRPLLPLILLLVAAAPIPAGREYLGRHGRWVAFRDGAAARCFAIAEPLSNRHDRGVRPFASFALWRGSGRGVGLDVRLSRAPRAGSPVTLRVGERRFALVADATDAWGRSVREDARIVAAVRRATRMEVAAVDARGRRFADAYALAGAPSAIDAAIVGCLETWGSRDVR